MFREGEGGVGQELAVVVGWFLLLGLGYASYGIVKPRTKPRQVDRFNYYGLVRMPRNPIILRAHLTTAPLETTNCSPLTPPSPRLYLQVP